MIAEVKELTPRPTQTKYDRRACGECESGLWSWHTAETDLRKHMVMCLNCGTAYYLNGECPDDFEAD